MEKSAPAALKMLRKPPKINLKSTRETSQNLSQTLAKSLPNPSQRLQNRLGSIQETQEMAKRCRRTPKRRPKSAQEQPKSAQDLPKPFQNRIQEAPRPHLYTYFSLSFFNAKFERNFMVFSMIFHASNLGFYRSCRSETLFFYKIESCEASTKKH